LAVAVVNSLSHDCVSAESLRSSLDDLTLLQFAWTIGIRARRILFAALRRVVVQSSLAKLS
jgi:hypothetical protein